MLLSLKLYSSNTKIEILKEVTTIDASDIKEYIIGMQIIQKKLWDIDTSGDHCESQPAAYMTNLLKNLNEDQTKDI